MKRVTFVFAVLFLVCACNSKDKSTLETLETDKFSVETQILAPQDIASQILLNGTVKAWEEAIIFPRVSGKLLQNLFHEGDKVSKNQTIATIDRDEVGVRYEPVLVPSTINGVIGKNYLDSGASVTTSTPISMVVNQEEVRVLIELPERYIGKIFLGQKANFTVDAFEDKVFNAEVYKISPVVDVHSRAVTVELKADNRQGLLKTGMFAKVNLVFESKENVLALQASYLLSETDENGVSHDYAFTLNPDDTVTKVLLTTGLKTGTLTEVKSGLKNGDEIVKVVFGLKDGSKVKVEGK